jgi:hypothetical protein
MITLPLHISHVFQALNVAYFKPFKITFRRKKNGAMARNNYCETHKITFTSCVEKSLDQVLIKTNIIVGLKTTRIWL